MKKMNFIIGIAALAAMMTEAQGQSWDFTFSYRNVFATNALDYVVEQGNITRTSEGNITYWNPINNGSEARLTQKFVFPKPTAEAFLNIDYIYIANFAAGTYGFGSLWGSKDGTNWIQLLNAPRPAVTAIGYSYSTNLPPALMGSGQLWIQSRLQSQGWNIMGQFLRYDVAFRTNNAFDLKVMYDKTLNIRKAVYLDTSNLAVGTNYQLQVSSDLLNWTNQGADFNATNSYWRSANYWDVDNWEQLFFRLKPQ